MLKGRRICSPGELRMIWIFSQSQETSCRQELVCSLEELRVAQKNLTSAPKELHPSSEHATT